MKNDLLREICNWLSHQKGMIPQDYAKELAKYITSCKPYKKDCKKIKRKINDS